MRKLTLHEKISIKGALSKKTMFQDIESRKILAKNNELKAFFFWWNYCFYKSIAEYWRYQ